MCNFDRLTSEGILVGRSHVQDTNQIAICQQRHVDERAQSGCAESRDHASGILPAHDAADDAGLEIFEASEGFDRNDGPLAHLGGNFVVQGDDLPGLSHRVEQGDAHSPAGDQALHVTDRRLRDLMR